MNLREQAEADNEFLLEDSATGFGTPITLTSPEGFAYSVTGQYNRIGVDIDPETGLLVQGNRSSITVRLKRLDGPLPGNGWSVKTTDITGADVCGIIANTMLDRTAGRATFVLRK